MLERLAETVASHVLLDAIETSQRLAGLGVPHALIGGLAVGMHGHPRATKDVDFLVGDAAFARTEPLLVYREELRDLVRVGVIDLMPVPPGHPELALYLRVPDDTEVPIIGPEALVLLKLLANRPQDRADVVALLGAGLDVAAATDYLRRNAPELTGRFAALVAEIGA